MNVVIVFFNQERTDYFVIGPYRTIENAERAIQLLKRIYVGAHAIEAVSMDIKPPLA